MAPYGRVPRYRRRLLETATRVAMLQANQDGSLGAAGLVWNEAGQVLLVKEDTEGPRRGLWVTPGGMADGGELPDETFRRETREETDVEVVVLALTCVYDLTVTDGVESARGFLFQFEGEAREGTPRPGDGVLEVRWFDALPEQMAFREDYRPVFAQRRRETGAGSEFSG